METYKNMLVKCCFADLENRSIEIVENAQN